MQSLYRKNNKRKLHFYIKRKQGEYFWGMLISAVSFWGMADIPFFFFFFFFFFFATAGILFLGVSTRCWSPARHAKPHQTRTGHLLENTQNHTSLSDRYRAQKVTMLATGLIKKGFFFLILKRVGYKYIEKSFFSALCNICFFSI